MINRINLILKAKNITARQFAEEIGIQASGMSHIMGGRNNPSLDFVTKVIRRYPEIDANWLLLGRGEMYMGTAPATPQPTPATAALPPQGQSPRLEETLFPELDNVAPAPTPAAPQPAAYSTDDEVRTENTVKEPSDYVPTYMAVPPDELAPKPAASQSRVAPVDTEGRHMVRLLFIYSDGTFEECLPAAGSGR